MKNTESEKVAFGYLNAIIGEILGKTELYPAESPEADVTTRVLRYCSEHFKEDISISSVASALYISTSYVSKLFSGKLKYKFREYINALRIEEAKRLLSNSDLQIVEVMLECGFKNQSSFNRVFAQICGTTPYQYRKDNRNTREVKI